MWGGRRCPWGATSTVKSRDWILDAMEYGSLRANAWLLVGWLGGGGRRQKSWRVTVCARCEDREFPAPHILEGTMSCEVEPLVYLWETTPHCVVGYLCYLLVSLVPGRWAMIPTPHALRSSDVILVPSPYTSPISCKGSGLLWRLPSSMEEAASFLFHITLF